MIKELQNLGFTEKEAKIYVLLATEGELSAPKISKILDIDRRTIYDTLNSLFKKGRISKKKVQNREIFSAVEAKLIKKEFEERLTQFEKIIPQLKKKEPTKSIEVNILYGTKAIQTLITKALESKSEIFLMGRGGYLIEQLREARHQYIPKINKLNLKMIQTSEYKNKEFKPKELKYLSKDIKFDTAFLTFSNNLYLFSKHKEIFLIEIIDKSFADTYKKYFKIFWKLAKP